MASNLLITAKVELLLPSPQVSVPERYEFLVEQLRFLVRRSRSRNSEMQPDYDVANWVSFRLAELMPLQLGQKQYVLQLDDPVRRLEALEILLEQEESA